MDITLTFGDIVLEPTIVNSLLVVVGLTIFFIICSMVIKKADPTKPSTGFMGLIEFVYSALHDFTSNAIGDAALRFIPFVVTAVFYLAVANLIGLLGLTAPTTNINITVALAVITLLYIMFSGIFSKGLLRYLKDNYMGSVRGFLLVLFIPINIVGELSKIISLSFRLFGNIVSGALLLTLVTGLLSWLFTVLVPLGGVVGGAFSVSLLPALNAYFDIFAGLMQTFIFCTLTTMWIRAAVESES
ncbi:MAG: F0F1 ATP synthase subunit A [Turicibacter sp.]|nr:F0F1 ATP synthase subunit A [Turicibacter sp.]